MMIDLDELDIDVELDSEIWALLGPDAILKTTVTAFHAHILKDNKNKMIAIAYAIRPSHLIYRSYFSDIETNKIPFRYLTKNEKQVIKWGEIKTVTCSEQDWLKAIGRRSTLEEIKNNEENNTLEECELQLCCSTISDIRDILLKCQKNAFLTNFEIELLKNLLENGGHEMPNNAPILDNILQQLGIRWS
jgi:hypothetical protein